MEAARKEGRKDPRQSDTHQQLRRSVLRILRALLLPDLAQIPDVEAAVGARAGEDGLVVWRPLHLEDLVLVRLERVQLQLQVAQVPERYGLPEREGGECGGRQGGGPTGERH